MITHSESTKAIAPALMAAQRKMGNALKDANNDQLRSRYATLQAVLVEVRDNLYDAGILFTQHPYNDGNRIGVETMLLHIESGEWMRSSVALETFPPHKGVSPAQVAGSIITYLRKFSAAAIGAIGQEDDDGAGPRQRKTATSRETPPRTDQFARMREICERNGVKSKEDKGALCEELVGCEPGELTAAKADELIKKLEKRFGEDGEQ